MVIKQEMVYIIQYDGVDIEQLKLASECAQATGDDDPDSLHYLIENNIKLQLPSIVITDIEIIGDDAYVYGRSSAITHKAVL